MTSENNIGLTVNDNYQNNNNNCQNDAEINIDYESWFKEEPKIKGLIMDLRNRIDNIVEQKKILKEHVLELARNLQESKLCDEDKISITIKAILKEEIKNNKISSRWIEKILSEEYKRKYEKNKANSSLSKKKKQTPLLVTDNSGKSFTITQEDNISTTDTPEKNDSFYYYNDRKEEEPTDIKFSNVDLIRENKEHKEPSEKTTTSQSTYNLIKEIQIPKEKSKELLTALDKCTASVFIRFDTKGIIQSIESDTIRERQFENVDDNYTY